MGKVKRGRVTLYIANLSPAEYAFYFENELVTPNRLIKEAMKLYYQTSGAGEMQVPAEEQTPRREPEVLRQAIPEPQRSPPQAIVQAPSAALIDDQPDPSLAERLRKSMQRNMCVLEQGGNG